MKSFEQYLQDNGVTVVEGKVKVDDAGKVALLREDYERTLVAAPQRSRKLATKALKSKLVKTLAEHMMKFTVYPEAPSKDHWEKEIRALFSRLVFEVSADSVLKENRERCIVSFHYELHEVIEAIDELSSDALDVLKNYKNEKLVLPKNFENGNLFDYGWTIKETRVGRCLFWTLSYQEFSVTAPS